MAWLRRGPSDSVSEEEEAPVNPNDSGRGPWDGGDSARANLDSPLGPINDPMMGTVTNHDSTLIAGETYVGGAAVEENQSEENEKLIGAINAGLVVPTVADCNTDSTHSSSYSDVNVGLTQDPPTYTLLATNCSRGGNADGMAAD
ncbi:hypothetical protein Pyn_00302 [Prunus yedoensis var. nudiflora]|uniref:Uncharacterized protein n=1 Tax=Prunus yedoensis var. nudiflora TaxID=2094558 RepID=A0A314UD78_PRUYE|nr:hypothetical protein Pyn_00302 [Prunus yedoensis var. nudiflora]